MRVDLPEGMKERVDIAYQRFIKFRHHANFNETSSPIVQFAYLDYFDDDYEQIASAFCQRAFAYLIHHCGKEIQAALDASERKLNQEQTIRVDCENFPIDITFKWTSRNQKHPKFTQMKIGD